MIEIKFAKIRPTAIIPSKRECDAGYDLYIDTEEYPVDVIIQPGEIELFRTGIASAFSSEYVFLLEERGSTGTKGISRRAGVIDSNYRGEWMIPINNTRKNHIVILKDYENRKFDLPSYCQDATVYPMEKAIAQALFLPVPKTDIKEITFEELIKIESVRGNGKLGSSGK